MSTKNAQIGQRRIVSPIPAGLGAEYERLQALDTAALRQELKIALTQTAEHFARLAMILRVLEERGFDLSELRIGFVGYLRKIAYGQLLPEILADFGLRRGLLQRLSDLPLADQQRVYDEGVAVGMLAPDGTVDQVIVPLAKLSWHQALAAFDNGRLRSPEEQLHWQRFQRKPLPAEAEPPKAPYEVRGNRCVVHQPITFSKRNLQDILKLMG